MSQEQEIPFPRGFRSCSPASDCDSCPGESEAEGRLKLEFVHLWLEASERVHLPGEGRDKVRLFPKAAEHVNLLGESGDQGMFFPEAAGQVDLLGGIEDQVCDETALLKPTKSC